MILDLPVKVQRSIDRAGVLFAFRLSKAFRENHAPFVGWKRQYAADGTHVGYLWFGEGPMQVPVQHFLPLDSDQLAQAAADPLGPTACPHCGASGNEGHGVGCVPLPGT